MNPLLLVLKSLLNRAFAVGLVIITLSLSIALYLGVVSVERLTRASFENSVSGVDLIIAPRGSDVQILLYTIFNIGAPSANISWQTSEQLAQDEAVAWRVPISLGDSHKGYRVIGTSKAFFENLRFRKNQPLEFSSGTAFDALTDVVIGADVARALHYQRGEQIILQHGLSQLGQAHHDDIPFTISGILSPTGTPYDKAVLVSLEAIEAMHAGWQNGQQLVRLNQAWRATQTFTPQSISATLIGVKNPLQLFHFQRRVNNYEAEAITAILPGVALAKIWRLLASVDIGFRTINIMVIAVALIAMLAMIMAGLDMRRRELAILRGVGASPKFLVIMLMAESFFIALFACLIGTLLSFGALQIVLYYLNETYGLVLDGHLWSAQDLWVLAYIIFASLLASIIPAIKLYRNTVQDSIMVRM